MAESEEELKRGKKSACNAGDLGLIPGLGRSLGEGKGYPLQYSGLENSMDYTVHGVTKSQMQLSDFHWFTEREVGASQVVLVVKNLPASAGRPKRCGFDPWVRKIPWRIKWQPTPLFLPGESHGQRSLVGYGPWGHRVGHDWSDLAQHNTAER